MSKAFCLAFALLVSVTPAGAGELTLSPHPVQIKETDASRLYRAKWLMAHGRDFSSSPLAGERTITHSLQSIDVLDALPAKLRAKVRRLLALVEEEARSAPGPQFVRFHLRVHCSTRRVMKASSAPALSTPALARPALMWLAVASEPEPAPQPSLVRSTVKTCSVKFVRSQRPINQVGTMRPFSVTLPSLTAGD